MYFELFLLDDLLLNLLILRLAAALVSVRPPMLRMSAAALLSALASAAAAFLAPVLRSPPFRLPLLLLLTFGISELGLPFKKPKVFLKNAGAVLFATFAAGGCAVVIAVITGGGMENGFLRGGIGLRTALLIAVCASFLPSAARRLLRRRLANGSTAEVVLLHDGRLRRFTALVDTGNSLFEPVTGLPVAVVRCPELRRYAVTPIPAETAAGRTVLMGFRPEGFSVNGKEVACVVAVTESGGREAIIPPDIAA